MPELPEVETIRRGIEPLVAGKKVSGSLLRSTRLRWLPPVQKLSRLRGQQLLAVERRAKYLIFRFSSDWLLLHMGMSGTLRYCRPGTPPGRHDHFDLVFSDGFRLRFRDPRKFGGVFFFSENPFYTSFFSATGPEPFSPLVNGKYLYLKAHGKKIPVKSFIMDQKILAGVGNIYASEALFLSGVLPSRPAGKIAKKRFQRLAEMIRLVLTQAIAAGGTSFRDFLNEQGSPGYFAMKLLVYGKNGRPCPNCGGTISTERVGQRSTFFCRKCQH